jgi:hypothetical protein
MSVRFILLFYWSHLPKLICIYLSVWAYRYTGDIDYRFGRFGMLMRWTLTVTLFISAVSFPTRIGRVMLFCVALAFFCWPNFSYHLLSLFRKHHWPTAEARVVHIESGDSSQTVSYSFRFRGEVYGGTSILRKAKATDHQPERIMVRYDPVNPDCSEVVG